MGGEKIPWIDSLIGFKYLPQGELVKKTYIQGNSDRRSVVEPFHFGPAPALASQDGGSGFGSSSSPVVHNLLLKKKVFKNFTSQFTGTCFIQRKVRVLCFALPVLNFKRKINFILHYC